MLDIIFLFRVYYVPFVPQPDWVGLGTYPVFSKDCRA